MFAPHQRRLGLFWANIGVAAVFCSAGFCGRNSEPSVTLSSIGREHLIKFLDASKIDGTSLQKNLQTFAGQSHPFGSPAQKTTAQWLAKQAKAFAENVWLQEFSAETPNPVSLKNPDAPANSTIRKSGYNVIAYQRLAREAKCLVMVSSHFDTKILEGIDYFGANDSGSSSLLLLELLHTFKQALPNHNALQCDLLVVWFDGEESVLPNWDDGEKIHPAKIIDHLYGSRYFAEQLQACKSDGKALCITSQLSNLPIIAAINIDMVGSKNIQYTRDSNSSVKLLNLLQSTLAIFNEQNRLNPSPQAIADDHLPLHDRGLEVLEVIDFNHLEYWHKAGDNAERVDADAVELTRKVIVTMILQLAEKNR